MYRPLTAPATSESQPLSPANIPEPTAQIDACKTPFVQLSSARSNGKKFGRAIAAFDGHAELQDDLVFLEIRRKAATPGSTGEVAYFFGAQARTIEAALAARTLAEASKLEPQIVCLDATGRIPDPTKPPTGVRVYWLNLATKQKFSP